MNALVVVAVLLVGMGLGFVVRVLDVAFCEEQPPLHGSVGMLLPVVSGAAATAACAVELFAYSADTVTALCWSLACWTCFIACLTDLDRRIVSNWLVLVALLVAVLLVAAQVWANPDSMRGVLATSAAGALTGGVSLLLCRIVTRGGVGAGDIKLYFVLGLLLGFRGLFNVLLYGMLVAFVYCLFLLATRRKKLNDQLPLAPFSLIGVVACICLGA